MRTVQKAGMVALAVGLAIPSAYFLATAGKGRAAEEQRAILAEHGTVCGRLGASDETSRRSECLSELTRLQHWHEQRVSDGLP